MKAGVIAFLKEQPGAGECVAADGISARSSALFDCAGETSKPVEFIVTEVMNQRRASRESGGKFVIPVPDFRVV